MIHAFCDINKSYPLHFYIMQAIKDGKVKRPGNEAIDLQQSHNAKRRGYVHASRKSIVRYDCIARAVVNEYMYVRTPHN